MSADPQAMTEPDLGRTIALGPPPGGVRNTGGDRYIGSQLDHFHVERLLGSGGMGVVYAARDVSLDRPVALKLLPVELASREQAQQRFIREAQAQAGVRSPHVVQIYFIGRIISAESSSGGLYFVMERIEGDSLDAPLDRGERLDPERARTLMIQAARGLRDAHQAGIVHRDVKPGNLLVDEDHTLKVADFGLAKPRDPKLGLTRDGAVMGTPHYMPPEQALGHELDHRADMYALGCTFYHLLAGVPPFEGATAVALIAKHLDEKPVPLQTRVPTMPPALAAIIDRLLEKNRDARFESYESLIDALVAAAPERVALAGFWTRGAAFAIDWALACALVAVLGWPGFVLHLAHLTIGHARFGQSLAKYALHIQVCRPDGTPLGAWRSLARTFVALWLPSMFALLVLWTQGLSELGASVGKLAELGEARQLIVPLVVSNVLLTLLYTTGFVLAALRKDRRAIHDLVVGSIVRFRLRG